MYKGGAKINDSTTYMLVCTAEAPAANRETACRAQTAAKKSDKGASGARGNGLDSRKQASGSFEFTTVNLDILITRRFDSRMALLWHSGGVKW